MSECVILTADGLTANGLTADELTAKYDIMIMQNELYSASV